MNFKVEHAIIAVLVLALLYYVYSHRSLLNDLSVVPHDNNPQLKEVKGKHVQKSCRDYCIGAKNGDCCCRWGMCFRGICKQLESKYLCDKGDGSTPECCDESKWW